MHNIETLLQKLDCFEKIASSNDIFVFTFVRKIAIESIKEKGLLSAVKLIEDDKALKLARPDDYKTFKKNILKDLEDPWKASTLDGVSTFFTLPDWSQVPDKHFIFKRNLVPLMVNLTSLMKDIPKTILMGVEMKPYDPKKEKYQNRREYGLKLEDVKKYTDKSPEDLWKNYNKKDLTKYAPDVPHLIIKTPDKYIKTKYIKF